MHSITGPNSLTMMSFPLTVDDHIDELTAARSVLRERLAGKPQPGLAPSRAGAHWSPAEIAFHLYLSEENICGSIKKILASGERRERKDENHLRQEWQRVRNLIGIRGAHVKSPPSVQPLNAPCQEEAIALLDQSRRQLLELLGRVTLDDLASISAPHPFAAFGTLTGATWLSVIAFHELRHAEQIEELTGDR